MTAPPRPATAELLALAAATRPDDVDHAALAALIAECMAAGRTSWGQVMVQTVRVLAHPGEDLRDLRIALKLDPRTRY